MDPVHTLLLLGIFITLLVLGVPIAVGIALSALVTLLFTMGLETASITVAQRIATGLDRFTLLAIPFFILSGQLMNRGGSARRLVDLARAIVDPLEGRTPATASIEANWSRSESDEPGPSNGKDS